jgi:hypothetical protein
MLIFPAIAKRGELDMESQQKNDQDATSNRIHVPAETSQCIDWYAEGESRVVEIGDVQVIVRCVGRKGRRARIAITAPPGAAFRSLDLNEAVRSPDRFV